MSFLRFNLCQWNEDTRQYYVPVETLSSPVGTAPQGCNGYTWQTWGIAWVPLVQPWGWSSVKQQENLICSRRWQAWIPHRVVKNEEAVKKGWIVARLARWVEWPMNPKVWTLKWEGQSFQSSGRSWVWRTYSAQLSLKILSKRFIPLTRFTGCLIK